jgi:hypothetical protein
MKNRITEKIVELGVLVAVMGILAWGTGNVLMEIYPYMLGKFQGAGALGEVIVTLSMIGAFLFVVVYIPIMSYRTA